MLSMEDEIGNYQGCISNIESESILSILCITSAKLEMTGPTVLYGFIYM